MPRTLTLERIQKKEHAITLRKQGWTERAIAEDIAVPRQTISDWLRDVFADNATMGNTSKSWHSADNHKTRYIGKKPEFHTFNGSLEDFETDIRFPLIIADPPWNISVENSMRFTFKDKGGKQHTPMIRSFGNWDFQGDEANYLQAILVWLSKLYSVASDNALKGK